MVIGVFAVGLLVTYTWKLAKDIHAMAAQVSKLDATISHEEGDPVKHYTILREIEKELEELRRDAEIQATASNKHYDISERLASGDAMLTCNVDKCPYMSKIVASLVDVVKRFDEFNIRAEDSRKTTGASIEDIRKQNETLSREISEQNNRLVNILSDVIIARGKK